MRRGVRAAVLSLVVALAVALGTITYASAASASVASCYGSSCDGLDPAQTNCVDDAQTLMSQDAVTEAGDFGLLELRYSPRCHSNWVRFTPWTGVRAWLGNFAAKALPDGTPWIWRLGVADSLRGEIGHSSYLGPVVTTWTAMVTADGTTCSSVGVYETETSESGQGDRRSLGTYNAPCIS